jgi:hypothetical protein
MRFRDARIKTFPSVLSTQQDCRLYVHQAEVTMREKVTHHPREAENDMNLQPMDTIADVVGKFGSRKVIRCASH